MNCKEMTSQKFPHESKTELHEESSEPQTESKLANCNCATLGNKIYEGLEDKYCM